MTTTTAADTAAATVRIRPLVAGDLGRMFELQLDAEASARAGCVPRTREAFFGMWGRSLSRESDRSWAIEVAGEFAGHISRYRSRRPDDGKDLVAAWIDRRFWGTGVGKRAMALMLEEDATRPLYARVATTNSASMKLALGAGFVTEAVGTAAGNDRYLEVEEALLVLR